MDNSFTTRMPCCICGRNTFRRHGWFVVIDNRWLDRLKILSWHPSLASRPGAKSVCCRQHLKTLVAHWLTRASLQVVPSHDLAPIPIATDPKSSDPEVELQALGRLIGELAVHRESFSRVWSGSPESLECILDALLAIGSENTPQPVKAQFLQPLYPRNVHHPNRAPAESSSAGAPATLASLSP